MKKGVLVVLISLAISSVYAQTSIRDREATFYGLDFSKSKMIGSEGFTNPTDIVDRFFFEWNNMMLDEKSKYNVKKAFNKDIVDYDFGPVSTNNKKVKASELVINRSYSIEEKDVASIVRGYAIKGKGLGIVMIVEKFDKTEEKASVYVTYFDKANKKILLTRKVAGKPSGFGLKAYWANAIGRIMASCSTYVKAWEAGSK
ncbi:MAG: hypothetical protein MH137_03215 [Flavobacteriales bacterium]|nr:hypothetical protein [Flavobacteriales bacterium]